MAKRGTHGPLSVTPQYDNKSEWGKVGNTNNPEWKIKRTAGLAHKAVGKPDYSKAGRNPFAPKYPKHVVQKGKPIYGKNVKSKAVD